MEIESTVDAETVEATEEREELGVSVRPVVTWLAKAKGDVGTFGTLDCLLIDCFS